jgi:hypothetical protein
MAFKIKKLAALAALAALALPAAAFDPREAPTSTIFYISIPLDTGLSRKAQRWSAGLRLQGAREHQAVDIDSRMLNFAPDSEIDGKWIIAGLVALGAAVAIGGKNGSTSNAAPEQPAPCTRPPSDPCAP